MQTPNDGGYPVFLRGELDAELSRWKWLIKWLLAIPHIVILVFLWLGLIGATIIAFFAILFTGRYPRSLFDYNVGVLRWNWRVGFYCLNALGSDRYPPFTLADGDYPAGLEIEYPERLSRGLVLVKWIIAIPHLLIIAVLHGGVGLRFGGLNAILIIVAMVALLFTGRYPAGIFDLVVGINRWHARVAAYGALMTDRYPPFRFEE